MTGKEQVQKVRDWLVRQQHRHGRASLQSKNLIPRISREAGLNSRVQTIRALKAIYDDGEIHCSWMEGSGPIGKVALALPAPPVAEREAAWARAVEQAASRMTEEQRAGLLDLGPALRDWPVDQDGALIAELLDLAAMDLSTDALYLVSARGRLASSKLLSSLPNAALNKIGIPTDCFREQPPYVVAAGPAEPRTVLLIENPNGFERAVHALRGRPVALVSAYGFALSRKDGAGERLADIVEHDTEMVTLARLGSPPDLRELTSCPNLFWWGDLDLAGLQIYQRCRSAYPHLQLSALYRPMLQILEQGGGHPYAELTGKPGQQTWRSDDPTIKALLAACASRAVDQEAVGADDIVRLAEQGFEIVSNN